MLNQDPAVIVVHSDRERAEEFASYVRFLGCDTTTAVDESTFLEEIAALPGVLAIFIGAEPGQQWLAPALRRANEYTGGSPCYLLQSAGEQGAPPAGLRPLLRGTVSWEASYQELLGILRHARVLYDQRARAGDDHSATLYSNLIGASDDIEAVRQLARQVSTTEATVLVNGESGTGKEVVARCIHTLSGRRDKPFVPINCGAIPAELLESELFGHEKGAFTGAISARQGRFEIAAGGTLFLDEIGDMPLDMQVKLLRVLQERMFERVGSHKPIPTDVRVVAATHRNLEQMVADGSFRMDLFFRLNVFPIEISPLRNRVADIPLLVDNYIGRQEREQGRSLRLSDCAVASLVRYHWPGNVRELINLLERLAILFPDKLVQWSDLPEKFRPNEELFEEQLSESADWQQQLRAPASPVELPPEGIDLKPHLADIERRLMIEALDRTDWVVARAAKLLNLQRTTLVEKMRKFDIQRPGELTGS
ncbi:MAG: sigma-54-dependent Fis family transcriptional regulator [Halioglobus sp.]|nr:sigma-54-dependent Fis family transcriptional regulator [Halioglobus sp.]